jgi:hypothetical protein
MPEASDFEPRIRAMEIVAGEARGAVNTLKWILTPLLSLGIAAMFYLAMTISELRSSVNSHSADFARAEKAIEKLTADNRELTRLVYERPPVRPATAIVHEGKFVKIDGGALVLDQGPPNGVVKFKLMDKVSVRIKGQEATLADLKPGMNLRAFGDDGTTVVSIDVE